MSEFLKFAVIGLGVGGLYVICGHGLVVIFRGSGVVNFAQAAMGMACAYVFYRMRAQQELPTWFAMAVALLLAAAMGLAVQWLLIRPLKTASTLVRLVSTFGLLVAIQSVVVLQWGTDEVLVSPVIPNGPIDLGSNITIGRDRLYLLGISIVLTIVMATIYRYTRFGAATSAVAEDEHGLAALGWSPQLVASVNWMVGSVLAALASILVAPIVSLKIDELSLLVLPAMAAALVGRFTSFGLTLAAGLAIGVTEAELANYIDTPGISKSMPFLVIILYLVLRGHSFPARGELAERMPVVGSGRVRLWLVLAGTVVTGIWLLRVDTGWVQAFTTSAVFATIALSLVVVMGYAGQATLVQLTLAGAAGWFAVKVASGSSVDMTVAMLLALLVAVPLGVIVAIPSLRVRGPILGIATLGLALALDRLILRSPELTGGFFGLRIEEHTFFGIDVNTVTHPERYALVALGMLVAVALAVANLRRSASGRTLLAIRANERAASSLGVNVLRAKLYAFGVGSAIAAIGGVLTVFQVQTVVFAGKYDLMSSAAVVVFAVLGGIGSVAGAFLAGLSATSGLIPFSIPLSGSAFIAIASFGLLVNLIMTRGDGVAAQTAQAVNLLRARRKEARGTSAPASERLVTADRVVAPARLTIEGLTVRFGGVRAISDLSMTVGPGEIVGLIGPNGAGKTTLIDAVTGFERGTGTVRVNGTAVDRMAPHRRAHHGIGRSFQTVELFEDISVEDNLRVGGEQRSLKGLVADLAWPRKSPLSASALAAIDEFGLADQLDRLPSELSNGQRRLVGIARAVAANPSILLLDEPTAGLNEEEADEIATLVRGLADEWGVAVMLVEHDVGLVFGTCDRIVVLNFGEKIAEGTPAEVANNQTVVRAYLGEDAVTALSRVGVAPSLGARTPARSPVP